MINSVTSKICGPVVREFALAHVSCTGRAQDSALEVVGRSSGRLLRLDNGGFTVELSAEPGKLDAILAALEAFGPVHATRSGTIKV